MTELNRTLAPVLHSLDKIAFSFPESLEMDNGSQVFYYGDADSEVVKIEMLFEAGYAYGDTPLQASLTNLLITSGTSKLSQKQIAEKIDSYGAYFEKDLTANFASLTIYSLRKYAEPVLDIIAEVFNDCIFPESELENILRVRRQKFLIRKEKVSFLCKREFSQLIFNDHVYGRMTELEDYDSIQRKDIQSFFKAHYNKKPTFLLAGKVDDQLINCLNRLFGSASYSKDLAQTEVGHINTIKTRKIIVKDDAVQSAIRVGRLLFNRTHPDYSEMQILNTILGGYFGSRLMSNLREDKGFTYGVSSGIASLINAGYFFISTEVGAEVTAKAEKEILFELDRLRQEKVSLQELDTVKNYMLGQLLQGTDGVFSLVDRFKSLHIYDLNESHFQKNVSNIKAITPERLLDLAQQYFSIEDFTTVIAGRVD